MLDKTKLNCKNLELKIIGPNHKLHINLKIGTKILSL